MEKLKWKFIENGFLKDKLFDLQLTTLKIICVTDSANENKHKKIRAKCFVYWEKCNVIHVAFVELPRIKKKIFGSSVKFLKSTKNCAERTYICVNLENVP